MHRGACPHAARRWTQNLGGGRATIACGHQLLGVRQLAFRRYRRFRAPGPNAFLRLLNAFLACARIRRRRNPRRSRRNQPRNQRGAWSAPSCARLTDTPGLSPGQNRQLLSTRLLRNSIVIVSFPFWFGLQGLVLLPGSVSAY